MSEQICQKCGKPIEQCACGQEPSQVIEVRHTGLPTNLKGSSTDPSKAEIQEKLNEREEQLKVIALKQLEQEVTKWASVVPDEKKRKAIVTSIMDSEDPLGDFERKKEMLGLFKLALGKGGIKVIDEDDDGTEPVPPAGVARAPPKRNLLGSGIDQINRIYNTLESKTATEEQKAEARRRADQMVEQFIQGRRKAIRQDPQHKYYVGYVMCPKCMKSIFVSKGTKSVKDCPHCGAVLTKRA